MVVVAKFGGAALADASAIQRTAGIIMDERPDVVVASAMAGVTDALEAAWTADDPSELLRSLASDHRDAASAIGAHATEATDAVLEELAALLHGRDRGDDALHDRVLAQGERLSVRLLAAALVDQGVDGVACDAGDLGIRAVGPPGAASPDMDAIRTVLPTALQDHAGRTVVLTGLFGVDQDGAIRSFGRGGSDVVAAAVAAALGAERLDLWKDVPGFMTADPRLVPDARLVQVLEYQEAAELAHFGAKVLHPLAISPVAEAGVPVHIRSLGDPGSEGSRISNDAPPPRGSVRSAASRDGLAVLRLNGPGMGSTPGIGRLVFDALAAADVNVLNLANSQATFALLIQASDAERARQAMDPLLGTSIRSVDVIEDRSLVCVVGRGLGETPGSAARLLGAVSDRGVNIDMISLGASETAIDLVVPTDRRKDALQGLHDAFVEAA